MLKTLFFDFDGVIVDSLDVKSNAFYEIYKDYGETIAREVVKHHLDNGGMSRFEKFKLYHCKYLNQMLTDMQVGELAGKFSNLVVNEVIQSPFVSGIQDFLQNNHHRYNLFIITGTPTEEMKHIAIAKNISKYFKGIYGSPEKKDHWVKYLLTKYQYSPDECVFIGDALSDYHAAVNSNVLFILREHPDNLELFKKIEAIRISDFKVFETLLQSLQ